MTQQSNGSCNDSAAADGASCCARPGMSRRQFVKVAGAGSAFLASGARMPIMAGPFEGNEYLELIHEDKKLNPDWVRSLHERGVKEVYTDPDSLQRIGMPIGGFFTGTLYLSGDGRLWLWDVFNRDQEGILPRSIGNVPGIGGHPITRCGLNYLDPTPFTQPFTQGFELRIGSERRPLDARGFSEVQFDGRYPVGRISYRDAACPLHVDLEAFSPFVPHELDDSSLPVTVMRYTVTNRSAETVSCSLAGLLENAVCKDAPADTEGQRRNQVVREEGLVALLCSVEGGASDDTAERPDIVFDDFERNTYAPWVAEGEAFGTGPVQILDLPQYQGNVNGHGERIVSSHASAPGATGVDKDRSTGTLTSPEFTIERGYITMLVGGGSQAGRTCVNLLVDGEVVASVTGRNQNLMLQRVMDVRAYEGRTARLQAVDEATGSWGHIGFDHIVFTDSPRTESTLDARRDFGTMLLAVAGTASGASATADQASAEPLANKLFGLADSCTGAVEQALTLEPGQSASVSFVVAWHFPNFYARGDGGLLTGHHYAARFADAVEVARYVSDHMDRLAGATRDWVETWYDSSLPYWLLDRAMANTSVLATATCYRFADGRFWAWEGIGCCGGTCTHVWHYAQAAGRLFPELERDHRERVDFGIGFHSEGQIGHRAGATGAIYAADDGQCGRILGAYREHCMSTDDAFLRRLWPRIKEAIEYLIRKDGDGDGMIEGHQPNTLDAAWYGKISFLASLYLATLEAGEAMALEMGDTEFARTCRTIADRGAESILETYDGEYFIQIEDPAHKNEVGIGPGCYIDQIFGQTWSHWVGLGRLFDRDKQISALRALWRYNFVPDVGPFREAFPRGRWYAEAGEGGLLMCTWPKGGQNPAFRQHWQYMYFNECMSGFEYQVAAHMIWESWDHPDLLENGLAITRAIHDRYNAALRNPYNEIECSDHYSRAMASYGVYQAVCGFNCHGPKGSLTFEPRLKPEDFKAAFTAPESWGSLRQVQRDGRQLDEVAVKSGHLRLRELNLAVPEGQQVEQVRVRVGERAVGATLEQTGVQVRVALDADVTVGPGETLSALLQYAG